MDKTIIRLKDGLCVDITINEQSGICSTHMLSVRGNKVILSGHHYVVSVCFSVEDDRLVLYLQEKVESWCSRHGARVELELYWWKLFEYCREKTILRDASLCQHAFTVRLNSNMNNWHLADRTRGYRFMHGLKKVFEADQRGEIDFVEDMIQFQFGPADRSIPAARE
jgi:hypothetical protein